MNSEKELQRKQKQGQEQEKDQYSKMELKLFYIKSLSLLFLLACVAEAQRNNVFDVTKFGAKSGENSDISQAIIRAWNEACASLTPTKILIPRGSFLLGQLSLEGPCKSAVEMKVKGTLKAPADPRHMGDSWVTFERIDRFTLSGGGVFDGQGDLAWKQNDCAKTGKCSKLPVSIRFNFLSNSIIRGITSLNSKLFHINVFACNNVTLHHVTVTAPADSPNSDGIHLGRSTGINITDSNIRTGDDCISIGDGNTNVVITRVTCGPGHGISIGSLGKYPEEKPVEGITVNNCTISGTSNGIRIKTWPAGPISGIASNLHFEDIIMNGVSNPILIDQEYCPYDNCNKQIPSRVKISKVSFKNIRGTSGNQLAIKLVCSRAFPCENVQISEIDLKYGGAEGPATSQCANIKPILKGQINPPTCTA